MFTNGGAAVPSVLPLCWLCVRLSGASASEEKRVAGVKVGKGLCKVGVSRQLQTRSSKQGLRADVKGCLCKMSRPESALPAVVDV